MRRILRWWPLIVLAALAGSVISVWGTERCPVCAKHKWESTVQIIGTGSTSAIPIPYYEDGEAHMNPPNLWTSVYECSKGHKYTFNAARFANR